METHSHDRQFHIVVRRMTGDEKMMTEEDKCKEDLVGFAMFNYSPKTNKI